MKRRQPSSERKGAGTRKSKLKDSREGTSLLHMRTSRTRVGYVMGRQWEADGSQILGGKARRGASANISRIL
jgi:hypothetical protein